MIAHLILLSLYCAVGKTDVPRYSDNLKAIVETKVQLHKNVLSMDDNLPLLHDSRRHYALIVFVLNQVAKLQSSCAHQSYREDYSTSLELSVGYALSNPQAVIDETKKFIKSFDENGGVIQTLTEKYHNDSVVDKIVKADPEKYSYPAKVFFTAGNVATEYSLMDYKFNNASVNLSAVRYLVKGAEEVKSFVFALVGLHRQLNRFNCK